MRNAHPQYRIKVQHLLLNCVDCDKSRTLSFSHFLNTSTTTRRKFFSGPFSDHRSGGSFHFPFHARALFSLSVVLLSSLLASSSCSETRVPETHPSRHFCHCSMSFGQISSELFRFRCSAFW
ncbi:hypothetical protein RJT34_31494 [Clitoria ternatea]|uniref:Uncharacterized protein n=1 Tax=Clitoria ternatea TaxID=43366 RepID=A0AAN9EYM4_CLITE